MLRTILLLLMLSLAFPVLAQDREKKFAKAQKLYDQNKLDKAKKLLDKYISEDPEYAEYFYLRSFCFYYSGNGGMALNDISKAIQIRPDSVKYYYQRAFLNYKKLDFYKSNEDYVKAMPLIKTKTDSAEALALIGRNYEGLGDTLTALTNIEKAMELDSNSALVLNIYGLLLTDLEEYDNAVACMRHILRLDSTDMAAIHNLGYVYGVKGDYKNSIIYLDKIIDVEEDAFAYSNRGYAKMKLGDLNGALADLNKSVELNPYNAYVYRNFGLLYLEMDNKEKACESFSTALRYNFTEKYGNEVRDLRKKHCAN